ncbi:MAG: uracil-DNA glycosylase family protein [Pseudomonadota bacterium]
MPNQYGLPAFDPTTAVEGDPNSPIWIVALNPKTEEEDHVSGGNNPITWKDTNPSAPHFMRLQGILGPDWYPKLFQPKGIAHTDIVKCGSPAFTLIEANAVPVCHEFFLAQIKKHKPKLLLVLSSYAARIIAKDAGLSDDATEGAWKFGEEGEFCYVVLSGYSAPQQERYAKLRLKRDFLAAAQHYIR